MTNAPIEPRHEEAAREIDECESRELRTKAIAQTLANLEKARADLAEIDRIAVEHDWPNLSYAADIREVAAIAAPYRASDPEIPSSERDPVPAQPAVVEPRWQTEGDMSATPPASADAPGEVETIAIAMWQAESVRCSGRRRLIEWHEEHGTTQDSWRDLATAALSAMSPAGEVEQRGYDRAIAEVVAWLRGYDRDETNWPQVLARAIEAGEHKP